MDIQSMINKHTDWLNGEFSAVKVGEFFELGGKPKQ